MCFCGFLRLAANEGISIFYQLVSSTCGVRSSSTAFLFSLVNKPGRGPVTFNPLEARYSVIYSCPSYGPTFGAANQDIYIYFEGSLNTLKAYSYLGYTYNAPSGHSYGDEFTYSFLAGSYVFLPDEIEVFYETNYK